MLSPLSTLRTLSVLHATASIAPRDGGPSTAALAINRELAALGATSLIVTTDADGADGRLDRPTRSVIWEDGGRVLYCRRSRPRFLKNSWSQALRIRRYGRRADVVHVHGVYLANSVWTYLASRRHRTPYLVQPHGTLEPYQRGFSRLRKRLFDRLIGARILAGATALIAASGAEAEHLRSLLPGTPVLTVPLGVTRRPPSLDPALEQKLSAWLAVPPNQRVLFLGRLATKKRPDLLIEAWDALPAGSSAAQLLIVGPAQDWDAATLAARLSRHRRSSVTFLDAVDPPAVAWLMTEAGVFTLPSENENFAISVAEAMTYGCAVVTTAQTAASEHVAAADAGIVLPAPEAARLWQALVSLLTDPTALARFAANGSRYAQAELTWTSTASRLSEIYAGLARSFPAGSEPIGVLDEVNHLAQDRR